MCQDGHTCAGLSAAARRRGLRLGDLSCKPQASASSLTISAVFQRRSAILTAPRVSIVFGRKGQRRFGLRYRRACELSAIV